ncbi:hypothetical protein QRY02_11350 [Amycolatopsis sp. DG1A-15b]|nr:hypothetical protein [Amycolatopsis sp. DG1A-15b]WIX90993.1 hypothetical protein QRY02_11350 [Amycolatopsis sp. DG1A-15b]
MGPQREDELRQAVSRTSFERRFAVEPAVHRPRPRVPLGRFADRDDDRDRHRQPAERAEGLAFLRDVVGAALGERKPDRQGTAQAVHGVDRAARSQGSDRQARPLRELPAHQPLHERGVDGVFVGVHAAHVITEPRTSTRFREPGHPGLHDDA